MIIEALHILIYKNSGSCFHVHVSQYDIIKVYNECTCTHGAEPSPQVHTCKCTCTHGAEPSPQVHTCKCTCTRGAEPSPQVHTCKKCDCNYY